MTQSIKSLSPIPSSLPPFLASLSPLHLHLFISSIYLSHSLVSSLVYSLTMTLLNKHTLTVLLVMGCGSLFVLQQSNRPNSGHTMQLRRKLQSMIPPATTQQQQAYGSYNSGGNTPMDPSAYQQQQQQQDATGYNSAGATMPVTTQTVYDQQGTQTLSTMMQQEPQQTNGYGSTTTTATSGTMMNGGVPMSTTQQQATSGYNTQTAYGQPQQTTTSDGTPPQDISTTTYGQQQQQTGMGYGQPQQQTTTQYSSTGSGFDTTATSTTSATTPETVGTIPVNDISNPITNTIATATTTSNGSTGTGMAMGTGTSTGTGTGTVMDSSSMGGTDPNTNNQYVSKDAAGNVSFNIGGIGSPMKEADEGPKGTTTATATSIAAAADDSGIDIGGGGFSYNANGSNQQPQPGYPDPNTIVQQTTQTGQAENGMVTFNSGGMGSPMKESADGPHGTTSGEKTSIAQTAGQGGIDIGGGGFAFDANTPQQQLQQQPQQQAYPAMSEFGGGSGGSGMSQQDPSGMMGQSTSYTGGQTGADPSQNGGGGGMAEQAGYPNKVDPYAAGGPNVELPVTSTTSNEAMPSTSSSTAPLLTTTSTSTSTSSSTSTSTPGVDMSQQQFQADAAQCQLKSPEEVKVVPTWLSAYPGSGSKLTWQLIQAVTGIYTGDDYDSTGQASKGVVVAVKTHYPSHSEQRAFQNDIFANMNRAILLVRNPLYAIPAFFRFIYFDIEKNERKSESDVPPVGRWVFWRNANFDVELKAWVDHVKYWLTHFTSNDLYVLPFEHLVSSEKGSTVLQQMGSFLGGTDPIVASKLISPEQYCCVWEKVIKHSDIDGQQQQQQQRKEGVPSGIFTTEQLDSIEVALATVRDASEVNFPAFHELMEEYLAEVSEAKKEVLALSMNG